MFENYFKTLVISYKNVLISMGLCGIFLFLLFTGTGLLMSLGLIVLICIALLFGLMDILRSFLIAALMICLDTHVTGLIEIFGWKSVLLWYCKMGLIQLTMFIFLFTFSLRYFVSCIYVKSE